MSRQAALWQYVMTPRQETGLEGRKSFRRESHSSPLRWFRHLFSS